MDAILYCLYVLQLFQWTINNIWKGGESSQCLFGFFDETCSLDLFRLSSGSRASSSSNVYGAVPPPQQLLSVAQIIRLEHEESRNAAAVGTSHVSPSAVSAVSSTPAVPVVNNLSSFSPVTQPGILIGNGISGGNYSGTVLMSGTRYAGYEGIYPRATPLQQVAMVLKQSPSFTSSSTPAPTLPSAPVRSSSSSAAEKEKEKQPPQKRKFQELPIDHNVSTRLNQVLLALSWLLLSSEIMLKSGYFSLFLFTSLN